jgi:hypothetical protein
VKHPRDFAGTYLRVGDVVAAARLSGRSSVLERKVVTKIDDEGRVYLDNWHRPVIYTDRLAVIGVAG